ncbi:MAG: PQQ-like beta-propeller repeat protein [Acidobacteria bacterium]|nr:PQQ-like beta-propeller repeat protein [Acidobacteriota bacterium]
MTQKAAASKLLTGLLVIALTGATPYPVAAQTKKSAPPKKSAVAKTVPATSEGWPQWGGPRRDFTANSKGIANSWPAAGPKKLWSRDLGEGYSAVTEENGRIYTLYRNDRDKKEAVIAMEAASGKTVWENSYDAPLLPKQNIEYGPGPHATPLIVGDRLFAVGGTGKFHALDKNSGKVLWSHDFYSEYGISWGRGYSCSPLAYKDTVILVLGKNSKVGSVVAFDQKTGSVVWSKQAFDYGPGSPTLITLDGQEQIIAFMASEIVGLNPANGELYWSHTHKSNWGLNISTPVFGPGNLLFCSSAQDYGGGGRMLQLSRSGNNTTVKELWFSPRLGVHISTAVRVGDYIYTTLGDFGPTFLVAINARTGDVKWRERGFARPNIVYADGKLIALDEDGNLGLLQATPEGLKILGRAEVLKKNAWTAPTVVGTRLFIRDRKTIMAFDLS